MWNFFCLSFCVFMYKMAIYAQHGHLAFGPEAGRTLQSKLMTRNQFSWFSPWISIEYPSYIGAWLERLENHPSHHFFCSYHQWYTKWQKRVSRESENVLEIWLVQNLTTWHPSSTENLNHNLATMEEKPSLNITILIALWTAINVYVDKCLHAEICFCPGRPAR